MSEDEVPLAQPLDDINKRLDGSAVNSLAPPKKARLFNGLDADLTIYPVARNTYNVMSVKEGEPNKRYTVSVFHKPICECKDYVFRCINTEKWCKHIFRLWAEIRLGEQPPLGVEPDSWLKARLEDEIFAYISEDKKKAEELRDAYKRLEDNPKPVDFQYAVYAWRTYRRTPPQI